MSACQVRLTVPLIHFRTLATSGGNVSGGLSLPSHEKSAISFFFFYFLTFKNSRAEFSGSRMEDTNDEKHDAMNGFPVVPPLAWLTASPRP